MAILTGLEPAFTGRQPVAFPDGNRTIVWWRWVGSNHRHGPYESPALPLSYNAMCWSSWLVSNQRLTIIDRLLYL